VLLFAVNVKFRLPGQLQRDVHVSIHNNLPVTAKFVTAEVNGFTHQFIVTRRKLLE